MLNYEFPPIGGGSSPVAYELAKRYVQRGHVVDVVTMAYRGVPRRENMDGINVIRVPAMRSKKEMCRTHEMVSYVVSAMWFLRRRLKEVHYDINHTHFMIPTGIISLWAKRAFGLDYIITSHGSDVPGYNTDRFTLSHKFTGPLLRLVCSGAKRIVSPSHYLRNLIVDNIGGGIVEKLEVIPNGIDSSAVIPLPKKKSIAASGRLLPRKGFQYLIRAVSDKDIGYEVHILGDGPMMSELKRMARDSQTKIVFHGWVDNMSQQYREIIGSAAIYCLPSSKENGSVALLEGLSAGCAVITTNISGCPETVGDTGLTIEPRSSEAIKQALAQVIGDPLGMKKQGERARQRVKHLFDWDNITRGYERALGYTN